MLDPRLKDRLAQAYAKLGDISYTIALNMRKGKDHVPSQRALKEQGIKMRLILSILFRHITFDETNNYLPILWRISEEQVNKFLRCLILVGDLDKYPVIPNLLPNTKPIVIQSGSQGLAGNNGIDGSNANINVVADVGEDQIIVTTDIVGLTKTAKLKFVSYVKQQLSAIIQGGNRIFEIGTSQNFDILITSTKGTRAILTLACADPTLDAAFQPLVNLTTLNNSLIQPVGILFNITGQLADEIFSFNENDGKNIVNALDGISFYYPFMFGPNASILAAPAHYAALTKYINQKANYSFVFNDTNKYFYIAYPSIYGVLSKIRDENGYNVTSGWTSALINFTSSGLVNNWVVEYRVYRTTVKTSINGTYKIEF